MALIVQSFFCEYIVTKLWVMYLVNELMRCTFVAQNKKSRTTTTVWSKEDQRR